MFYLPDIAENHILSEEESAHCIRVLRMQVGSFMDITDGKGMLYHTQLMEAHPKHCRVEILSQEYLPKDVSKGRIEIAIAPTKNIDRTEWFVEKATEIGIDSIVFLNCTHSERKVVNMERIKKVAISAIKQSLQYTLPSIRGIVEFRDFVSSCTSPIKCIAHCSQNEKRNPLKNYTQEGDISILIGPEGDFSLEEIDLARREGFSPISLGNNRLRTETAALVACHTMNLLHSKE
ncbi:MAG TPA: 16S rRNA (uracil(1498)-N(3))-methyltransferase [Porphyromonadaceae bacterium]|nr:16S rRNA (uracil(1498)-N(3))-methyltransferase [Porphyromonadaceae bacterium]